MMGRAYAIFGGKARGIGARGAPVKSEKRKVKREERRVWSEARGWGVKTQRRFADLPGRPNEQLNCRAGGNETVGNDEGTKRRNDEGQTTGGAETEQRLAGETPAPPVGRGFGGWKGMGDKGFGRGLWIFPWNWGGKGVKRQCWRGNRDGSACQRAVKRKSGEKAKNPTSCIARKREPQDAGQVEKSAKKPCKRGRKRVRWHRFRSQGNPRVVDNLWTT